jgi:hypothetical protein
LLGPDVMVEIVVDFAGMLFYELNYFLLEFLRILCMYFCLPCF